MTVTEYIRRKNEMIFKHTGVVLVPENQIEECKQYRLSIGRDPEACPYCVAYMHNSRAGCYSCPMGKANNNCNVSPDSTYRKVAKDIYIASISNPWHDELKQLIDQYNAELEETDGR